MNPSNDTPDPRPAGVPDPAPETAEGSAPAPEAAAAEGASAPSPADASFDEFVHTVRKALDKGSEDARRHFEESLPKAREEFSKGVHELSYALAYAFSFGTELMREVTPESVTEGIREGREAGRRAAEETVRRHRDEAGGGAEETGPVGSPPPDRGGDAGPTPL